MARLELKQIKQRRDKLFLYPLIVSSMFLAVAHGCNDVVNVAAPIVGILYIKYSGDPGTPMATWQQIVGVSIAITGVIIGFITFGRFFLYKYSKKF